MNLVAKALVALIALVHVYILVVEMFLWETRGPDAFPIIDPGLFADTAVLAANQGLYNGFLAAGLIWSLTIRDAVWQARVATCFLLFVLIAGLYGTFATPADPTFWTPFIAQSVPAALALAAILIGGRKGGSTG